MIPRPLGLMKNVPWVHSIYLKILYFLLSFFILRCLKVVKDFVFLFLNIFDSAQLKNMFKNSVLGCSFMSQELRIFNCSNISYTFLDMTSNVTKILKKTWNCTNKYSKLFVQLFLLVRLSLCDPPIVFYSKILKMFTVSIYFLMSKNFFSHQNYLRILKISKQKSFEKIEPGHIQADRIQICVCIKSICLAFLCTTCCLGSLQYPHSTSLALNLAVQWRPRPKIY
jgi:hypothetical protein